MRKKRIILIHRNIHELQGSQAVNNRDFTISIFINTLLTITLCFQKHNKFILGIAAHGNVLCIDNIHLEQFKSDELVNDKQEQMLNVFLCFRQSKVMLESTST